MKMAAGKGRVWQKEEKKENGRFSLVLLFQSALRQAWRRWG